MSEIKNREATGIDVVSMEELLDRAGGTLETVKATNKMSTGAKIGTAAGIVAGLAALAFVAKKIVRAKKLKKLIEEEEAKERLINTEEIVEETEEKIA